MGTNESFSMKQRDKSKKLAKVGQKNPSDRFFCVARFSALLAFLPRLN
jgi:hypothetical protein